MEFKNKLALALIGLGVTAQEAAAQIRAFERAISHQKPVNLDDFKFVNVRMPSILKETKQTNFTPDRDHGWYRKFENKRRWIN